MKDYSLRNEKIKLIHALATSIGEHMTELFENGYDQGYADGKADTPFTDTEEAEKKAYKRGLNDMWEVIKKVIENEDKGGYSIKMLRKLFGSYDVYNITRNYTPEEALAKIKEYEDKQKQDAEIKVGDEVIGEFGNKGIVITNVPSSLGDVSVWFSNQTHVQLYPVKNLSKTGRHFDQIAEVLAELRGAE